MSNYENYNDYSPRHNLNYGEKNNKKSNEKSSNINQPFFIALIVLVAIVVILLIVLIIILCKAFNEMLIAYDNNQEEQNKNDEDNHRRKIGGKNKFKMRESLETMRKHRRNNKYLKRLNNKNENIPNNTNDSSGWQLYTLQGCPHCTRQLEELNGFETYIEFKRGSQTPIVNNIAGELYPKEKINGFPFWYNSKTGEKKMGRQNICELTPKIQSANC